MKTKHLTIKFGHISLPVSGDGWLHVPSALKQLGVSDADWPTVAKLHEIDIQKRHFGIGPEEVISFPDFVRLSFELDTVQARRWRKRAQKTLVGALQGDIRLAANIAERNPDPEERRWLNTRLESTYARRELMSTVARHGGEGEVFGQLGSLSNQSVLGADSATIRQERGVKNTRDGLKSEELLRLAYLDTATALAIQEQNVQGNADILRLHQQVAQQERQGWPFQAG